MLLLEIKSGVQIWDGITLEDNVFIGPNDFLPRRVFKNDYKKISFNSTIVGGITIGEYAMIGVVTKDVGSQELWYGNPATHRGYVCKCGQKCDEALMCRECEMGVNSYVCLMAA